MKPVWPFPVKDWATQFRRDDEGVDLQWPGVAPIEIYAVADGTLSVAGPDPNGFGMAYPLLNLDQNAMGFSAVYYGHTFPDWNKVGHRVRQGDVIGQTGGLHSGGNAYPLSNWLEIGFWVPTPGNGVLMHQWLDGSTAPQPILGAGPLSPIDSSVPSLHDANSVDQSTIAIARTAKNMVWQRMLIRAAFRKAWVP